MGSTQSLIFKEQSKLLCMRSQSLVLAMRPLNLIRVVIPNESGSIWDSP